MAFPAASRRRVMAIWVVLVALIVSACGLTTTPEEQTITFDGPPIVNISSPANGNTYQEGVGVNILLRVENAGPDVERVVVSVDDQIIGEQTLPNPSGDASFVVQTGWPASGEGQHTISAVASRANGSASAPASVTINVVSANPAGEDTGSVDTDTGAQQVAPTATEEPFTGSDPSNPAGQPTVAPTAIPATNTTAPTAQPTDPPPTATSSRPQANVTVGANIRSGPSVQFDPPLGSVAAGDALDIVAVNPAGTWYKVRVFNGEFWISATVVDVTGDIAALPRDAGPPLPPTPVPVTNTPVPTEPPASQIDLIVDGGASNFGNPQCLQPVTLQINVVNAGTEPSPATALRVTDIQPNGSPGATDTVNIPGLQPNTNATVSVTLTVSTFFNEQHVFRVTVDPDGGVPESNEGNNTYEHTYTLGRGSC